MDIKKLFKKVMSYEEMKDIPIGHIYLVIKYVIEAIGTGECFYETEFD